LGLPIKSAARSHLFRAPILFHGRSKTPPEPRVLLERQQLEQRKWTVKASPGWIRPKWAKDNSVVDVDRD
jgi:hypothetical protein